MKPLQHINDPNFTGVFFRRTIKNLEGAGGLWPEGKKLYSPWRPRVREQAKEIIFPSGAKIAMTYLERFEDAEKNHQGLQYSFVGFDELTHFDQESWLYLIGRLRSDATSDSFAMASCNPSPDSWVLSWVEWYLTPEGLPDEEKCGKVRYFVIVEDQPVFADTREELTERYPEICYIDNPITGETEYIPPLSFAFVNGTIFDNPALIKANPKYLSALKSQSEVNRARLLDGNWYARPEGSNYFLRDWLSEVDELPKRYICCRAWDKAGTEPSDVERFPDYTAGVKMYKDDDGYYYIVFDFIQAVVEDNTEVYGRFRKRAGKRDNLILEQAEYDGQDCRIVFPEDPGSAGKTDYEYSAKKFSEAGFLVSKDPMPSNKSKLQKASPFFNACENGLVRVVTSSFPNKATYDAYMKELEGFDGERSTRKKKDDWVDATAAAFNYLNKARVTRIVTRNQSPSKSLAADLLEDRRNLLT